MTPTSYGDAVAANVRAMRVRKQLQQRDVVERMRDLGFDKWHRQTISRVENGDRRLSPEEVLGLALVLSTSIAVLLGVPDDEAITFPDGKISGRDVTTLAQGRNNGAVQWEGNKAVFGRGVNSWFGELEDDPARDQG